MKIFFTSSRGWLNLPGVHIMTRKHHITVWPYWWVWYPRNGKYGWIHIN